MTRYSIIPFVLSGRLETDMRDQTINIYYPDHPSNFWHLRFSFNTDTTSLTKVVVASAKEVSVAVITNLVSAVFVDFDIFQSDNSIMYPI